MSLVCEKVVGVFNQFSVCEEEKIVSKTFISYFYIYIYYLLLHLYG